MSADRVADKINEMPTAWQGLTQGELTRLALTCFVSSVVCIEGLMLILNIPALMFVGAGGSAAVAFGLTFVLAKYVIAPRKVGKPFGYSDQKAMLGKARLGLKKLPTIYQSQLWFHKR